jgi:TonB family protein
MTHIKLQPPVETLNVPLVFNMPTDPMNLKEIKKESKIILKSVNQVTPAKGETREVFGLNRNSYTDESKSGAGMAVKMGNTIAKAEDKEILKATDSDSLPTPTEEYLVSQMPKVLVEVRPAYPKEAREKKSGIVTLEVLIDEKGNVRQVNVIESEDIFRREAVEAMKKFKFSPANINGKAVAVKIRYVIKFELEY